MQQKESNARIKKLEKEIERLDGPSGDSDVDDWNNVRKIDELRVYERAIVQPDYSNVYSYSSVDIGTAQSHPFGIAKIICEIFLTYHVRKDTELSYVW